MLDGGLRMAVAGAADEFPRPRFAECDVPPAPASDAKGIVAKCSKRSQRISRPETVKLA